MKKRLSLEKHLLDTPPVAMQQARNEVIYMLEVATKSVVCSIESLLKNALSNNNMD